MSVGTRTPTKGGRSFKYDALRTLEDNLKDYFRQKQQQEQLDLLVQRKMDTIRSPNNPNCWVQAKIRPTEARLRSSDEFLRKQLQ